MKLNESIVEDDTLNCIGELGYGAEEAGVLA